MIATAKTRQTGFTLLELLVSVLILSFGLLGIGGMMALTLKSNGSSYFKQLSVQTAYNVIDRMRANSQMAIAGSYNVNNLVTGGVPTIPTAPSTDCTISTCTPAQMAAYDSWYWLASSVAQLPSGCASVTTAPASGGNTLVTVTVQWDDSRANQLGQKSALGSATSASQTVSGNQSQFVTQTLL
ncbi:MAG: type IV pilus modification protein PilV [Rhodoferax sp.]